MVGAVDDGDLATARAHQRPAAARGARADDPHRRARSPPRPALQLLGVLAHRTVRLPLVDATDDEVDACCATT
ncbi:MAG: hypothetical protein WKF83_00715 [Nocardioidaceae bacterium]